MTIGFFVRPGSLRPAEDEQAQVFVQEDPTADAMIAALRTPVDVLWVDLAVLHNSQTMRQIRVMRPHTRILIGCDGDLAPPHPLVAQLVALGIYDLVFPDCSVAKALQRRPTYADVARWQQEPERDGTEIRRDAFVAPSARRRLLWRTHLESEPEGSHDTADSVRIVHPRRLLILGNQGGVGVSTLSVMLARWWHQWGLSVALIDAAVSGGLLPLAWDADPLLVGWDSDRKPESAWRQMVSELSLLTQSAGPRPQMITPDLAGRLQAAWAAGPGPSWPALVVDGGILPAWSGALKGFVDSVLCVVTADALGLRSATRLVESLLASGVPVAGFVVNRMRPGHVAPQELADAWRLPCLATFPDEPAIYDGLWHGRPSAALLTATEPLAQALTQEMAHPVNGRAKRAR